MNGMAAVIGYAFLICILIGTFWPGMNFHVYLLSDESALAKYQENVIMLEKRIAAKEAK